MIEDDLTFDEEPPRYEILDKYLNIEHSLGNRILKISNASRTEDNRAFKCKALFNESFGYGRFGNESRHLCSESSFYLRFQGGESGLFFCGQKFYKRKNFIKITI